MSAASTARAALVAVVLAAGPLEAAEPAAVALVRAGAPQELPVSARSYVVERFPKLFATCSLNSRDHPTTVLEPHAGLWEETRKGDHLRLSLGKPVDLQAGRRIIPAEQLLLGLQHPEFPGPDLSRNGDEVVAYVKCSGDAMIRFVCAPEVRSLMPRPYHRLCGRLPGSE